MKKRETCCWVFPARWAIFFISLCIAIFSAALIVATFKHRNAMMIHLSVINKVLPWVYIIILAVSGAIGVYGLLATVAGNYGFMILYRVMYWLMTIFIVLIWQIIIFILALVNRTKTTNACNEANPHQDYNSTKNATLTIDGYSTTLLGLKFGETYGFANCDQAVEAGIIGIAILLFAGGLFMTWFGFTVNRYTTSTNENYLGSSKGVHFQEV
ncbi:uncharacterized protein BX663DRAFT_547987 [Cokeromyces recurvatus]|uniref:uncharacterized protein n=1 Tax=Cokeromyces recurvatus TaxID=90255 RepID=UPI00221EB459|nr:uncharacterized protein BX663DRAFT_547987 [Cokeromyces recurvatus]KAI7906880.1 hypothetical protein BX663DRAFT_547987 [Cokeromyces recurvatus]